MKLAMIGSYGHTDIALSSAALAGEVEVVAAARYGPDDALGFVGQSPGVPESTPIYDDYRTMLDEVRPDIACVCMPYYRNAEASIEAARRGCHVFAEKPLATTLEDLSALRSAVGEGGVRIAAMFAMRADPVFQTVRKVIDDGRIGRPVLASAQKSYPWGNRDKFYRTRETYGGSIAWQAIHALEFVSYCMGRDYVRVAAMQSNEAHSDYPGAEDNGGMLLQLAGGGHAVIRFDYLRPKADGVERRHGDDRLRIAGTDGVVEVIDEGTRVMLMTPTDVEEVALAARRDLFAEFAASLTGDSECIVTPEESFRITEVALKARDAADWGKIVDL